MRPVVLVTAQVRSEARSLVGSPTKHLPSELRFGLRIVAGDTKPAVAKIGPYWVSWNGEGWVRPHRTWRGAIRSVQS